MLEVGFGATKRPWQPGDGHLHVAPDGQDLRNTAAVRSRLKMFSRFFGKSVAPADPWMVVGLLAAMGCGSVFFYEVWKNDPGTAAENGLMEWLQVILLCIGCLVYLSRVVQVHRTDIGLPVLSGLALLMFSFTLRELELDDLIGGAAGKAVERSIRLLALVLWAIFSIRFVQLVRLPLREVLGIVKRRTCLFAILGGFGYLISVVFEKEWLGLSSSGHEFGGQLSQLIACLLFVCSASSPWPALELADKS